MIFFFWEVEQTVCRLWHLKKKIPSIFFFSPTAFGISSGLEPDTPSAAAGRPTTALHGNRIFSSNRSNNFIESRVDNSKFRGLSTNNVIFIISGNRVPRCSGQTSSRGNRGIGSGPSPDKKFPLPKKKKKIRREIVFNANFEHPPNCVFAMHDLDVCFHQKRVPVF